MKGNLSAADAKALMRAIELGLVPKVKAFCAKGSVEVEVPLSHGRKATPLFVAARRDNAEIVGLLLAAGARVGGVDDYGSTMLHKARSAAVAKKLLDAGADVHARNKLRQTPLHVAAERGDPALVRLFIERGAEVDAKDEDGKTPFVAGPDRDVRAVLKEHGAKGLEKVDGRPIKPKKKRVAKWTEVSVEGGALGVDAEGVLWFPGGEGVFAWDGQTLTAFSFEESFSISEIAPGLGGRLFFATNWGLLVKTGDAWRLYGTEDSELHDQHLTSLTVDRAGRACVIAYDGEVALDHPIAVFDGKDFELWTAGAHFPAGLETECIAFDTQNRVALATGTGVTFADGTEWKAPGTGILQTVQILVPDGEHFWAGAARAVHRIGRDGKATQSIATPNRAKCLVVDGDTLWMGLSYGGLLRVRGKERKHFLDDEDIEGLALGKDGTVWVAAGEVLHRASGDEVTRFDGKGATKERAPAPVTKAPAKVKKRTLKPLPSAPLVPKKKLAPHVVAAIEAAKLEALTADVLFRLVRPAIGILLGNGEAAVGGSKLGGRPDLAPATKWPTYKADRDRYLPFLLQVNLADVAKHDLEGLLPKKGRLLIFCDTQPDEIADAHVVLDDAKKPARRDWPEDLVDRKNQDDFVAQLPERALEFYPTWTLPSAEYLAAHAELTDGDRTALEALAKKLASSDPKRSSGTRLLGWPVTLQGEIVASPDTIVLLQVDGEMGGPKQLAQLFSYWGNGIAHVLIDRKHLTAGTLTKAVAELAYT